MSIVDRTPGILLIESEMVDKCVVVRDRLGVYDDVLNPETYQLERPDADEEIIYQGAMLMKTIRTGDREFTEGEMARILNGYVVLLPKFKSSVKVEAGDPDLIQAGDILRILASEDHPEWLGEDFRVQSFELSTRSTYKRIVVQQISDSPGNPQF